MSRNSSIVSVNSLDENRFGSGSASQIVSRSEYDYVSPVNAGEMYLATLGSPASVRTVKSKLNCFARFFGYQDYAHCDWHLMRFDNVMVFVESLKSKIQSKELSEITVNSYIASLKGVAKTAWNLNQITDNDLVRIQSVPQIRAVRKLAGKSLSYRETKELLSVGENKSPQAIRDRAIMSLLLGCGLRRSEITNIELKNVHLAEGRIRLIGKGNKERDVFMNDAVKAAVSEWIDKRQTVIDTWNKTRRHPSRPGNAGDGKDGYLFGRWTNGYKYLVVNKPMSPAAVWNVVRMHTEVAKEREEGLLGVTTHDLRRTFATRLLENGVDLVVVRDMMGHSNIATTALYDRRGDEAMRKAASKLTL